MKKGTILYIHGFRSDGEGTTGKKLVEIFDDYNVITESFDANPSLVEEKLHNLIVDYSNKPIYIIGTSLGGFYALCLATQYNIKAFAINPTLTPAISLSNNLGEYKTYNLSLDYNFTEECLNLLKVKQDLLLSTGLNNTNKSYLNVLINIDDEVISHSTYEEYKKYLTCKYYNVGGHRAENINEISEYIAKHLNYKL